MDEDSTDFILVDDQIMCPLSAIDYFSNGESDSDFDSDDSYEYDKDGYKRKRKHRKHKGDDPSKAIYWSKMYTNFEYDVFNVAPENGAIANSKVLLELGSNYSTLEAQKLFHNFFKREPGKCKDWVYVRNYADCDLYCQLVLESSILPGIIGVDVEMENDSKGFSSWDSEWRTIRAHSRSAKGMFARTLQVSNSDGLVVVFDLYALAKPHSWSGGMECSYMNRSGYRVSLSTSALPQSLIHLILEPSIIRFSWAAHCDWDALYNSFGLMVPQKSYLDSQIPWMHVLRYKVKGAGNGLMHAASALFDIKLNKFRRGYGHFWHGSPMNGKLTQKLLWYAVKDAQTSLDIGLQVLVLTDWLKDWNNVWPSRHVQAQPMAGLREWICGYYGVVGVINQKAMDRPVVVNDQSDHDSAITVVADHDQHVIIQGTDSMENMIAECVDIDGQNVVVDLSDHVQDVTAHATDDEASMEHVITGSSGDDSGISMNSGCESCENLDADIIEFRNSSYYVKKSSKSVWDIALFPLKVLEMIIEPVLFGYDSNAYVEFW